LNERADRLRAQLDTFSKAGRTNPVDVLELWHLLRTRQLIGHLKMATTMAHEMETR
jgi:hypothetical protein